MLIASINTHTHRVPRIGGHIEALPEGFTERPKQPPDFPEYTNRTDATDGCAAQFDGKNNYHQVAEWKVKTGVERNAAVFEAMHGKNVTDAIANIIHAESRAAVARGDLQEPSTRQLVLHHALHKQTPSTCKLGKQSGWWAVDRIFWCYYDTKLFTKQAVPTAKGFKGSHAMHQFVGRCSDQEKAQRDGPLLTGEIFCACSACRAGNYLSCLLKTWVGGKRYVEAPLEKVVAGVQTQSQALAEWRASIVERQLVAVRVLPHDRHRYGHGQQRYWLANVLSVPLQLPESMVHSSQEFQAGWWVVRAQWFDLFQVSHRAYKLLPAEVLISVNSMIRLAFEWEKTEGVGRSKRYFMDEPGLARPQSH